MLFVTASDRIVLDTRSITQMVIIMGVEGMGGRARAENKILLDYAGHHRPREGGPAHDGSLSASNLSLTLNTAPSRSPVAFGCCPCIYIALAATTPLLKGSTQEVPFLNISDNEILNDFLRGTFK